MTVRECSEKLQVSRSTIYQLIAAGRLKCLRIGVRRGAIRVTEEQLEEFVRAAEGGRGKTPDPPFTPGSFKFLNAEKLGESWSRG